MRNGTVHKADFSYKNFSCFDKILFTAVGSLTLQFLQKKRLAAAPLSVKANTDRRLHGGLTKDVC